MGLSDLCKLRLLLIISVGGMLEAYDFIIYGLMVIDQSFKRCTSLSFYLAIPYSCTLHRDFHYLWVWICYRGYGSSYCNLAK